ncbi:interleukin-1 receptor-associated kinase 1 isoform X1 [Chiloscyllium plagiosum]|uniref:interleukin-1 receptor-associated kinase 1 isoform X1 n=1 Tax=Chiloscyllium plagiosum TaxID=36176 RepID=UPI001CB82C01|nr:interleukin-1 receptor-associated kinase 1 isoform X1 [Chiloscyllium plagiosum]
MSEWSWTAEYAYKLPAATMCEFCSVMDSLGGGDWNRFASSLVSDMTELRLLESTGKPGRTQNVMWYWMNRNGTVGDLLHILTSLNLGRARDIILSGRPSICPLLPPRTDPYIPRPPAEPLPEPSPVPSNWSDPGKSQRWKASEQATVTVNTPLPKPVLPRPPTPPNILLTDVNQSSFSSKDSWSKDPALLSSMSSSMMTKSLFFWPLHELRAGTCDFADSQKIGEGGFGCVYRALMRHTEYAVKRLKEDSNLDWKSVRGTFHTELEKLYQYRHPNIVDLAGGCVQDGVYCLVYIYMPNGSLQDWLQCQDGTAPLPWLRRLDVALGTARAIQFLHSSKPSLIHGDIKSSNILLDENFVPKLGDFGLARFSQYSNNPGKSCTIAKTKTLRGTLAYLPDEYIKSGQLSVELDTYSFGVVLLEILTGRKALESDGSAKPKYLKDLVEEEEEEECDVGEAEGRSLRVADRICRCHLDRKAGRYPGCLPVQLCALACECLQRQRKRRPKMTKVYEQLKTLRTLGQASGPAGGQFDAGSQIGGGSEPVDALAERLRSSSLSPVEDTYRFASQLHQPLDHGRSQSHPRPSVSCAARPSLYHSRPERRHGDCSSVPSLSSYSRRCQPVESKESSIDDGGGDSSSFSQRRLPQWNCDTKPSLPAYTPLPLHKDSRRLAPSGQTGLSRPEAVSDSTGAAALSISGTSQDSSIPSHQIIVNPAKQRILEQFELYNAGQIDSSELLCSNPRHADRLSLERRAPEESDDFDFS